MDSSKLCFIVYTLFLSIVFTTGFEAGDIRNHLGSRTPYRFVANKDDSPIEYPGCKESKIWMITRHGTRLPKAKDILKRYNLLYDLKLEILRQHSFGKGKLTPEQLREFEEWVENNIDPEMEKTLTHEGEDEMVLLAERVQKRFHNVVKNKYDNRTFLFRYTATQRAQQSARFFTLGLFDKRGSQDVIFDPASKVDHVLRFYKHCDRWRKQVKKNPETYKQKNAFIASEEMNSTLSEISKRLGLDYDIPFKTAELMYKMCGYETAWQKHSISPWCAAFDENTIKTFEYADDLNHFWKDSYGHDLTYRQACVSIKHMFDSFANKTYPKATFLFSHSGTLLKVLTHLQLYKPKKMLKWDTPLDGRSWRCSEIDTFATNLAFVLYKCTEGDFILALHQEKPIILPNCDKELCPLKDLVNTYYETIFNCDYQDMCSLEKK